MANQTLHPHFFLNANSTDLTQQLRRRNRHPAADFNARLHAYSKLQISFIEDSGYLARLVTASLGRAASAALGSRLAILGHLTLARVTCGTLLLLLRLAEIVVCRRGFERVGLWSRVLAL